MAKRDRDKDLFKMMRAAGVRRKVAAEVSDAVSGSMGSGKKATKIARQAVRDFSALAAKLEDRVSGGADKPRAAPQKRTRTAKPVAEPRGEAAQHEAQAPPQDV